MSSFKEYTKRHKKEYTKKEAKIQIKQKIKSKEICGNFFLRCHHARSILKKARIQIKQEIKSKEICGNFFLWCHHARSILKKTQEFKSIKKLNRKKFVEFLLLMSSRKEYTKKEARIQINQEIKSKEICGNFFLWCHQARSILKTMQEFKSNRN